MCALDACAACPPGQLIQAQSRERDGWREHYFTAVAGENLARSVAAMARCLRQTGGQLVELDVFGDAVEQSTVARERFLHEETAEVEPTCLITPTGGGFVARAVSGAPAVPLHEDGRVLGYVLDGTEAQHCWLGGMVPDCVDASPALQTRAVLERMARLLKRTGLTFRDVARTWYYLDDILGWYGDFNRVRTEFFARHHVFDGLMPASTGIGTPNAAGLALVAKAHAVRRHDGTPCVFRAESPLQGEAISYGSAFSRAVDVRLSGARRLHVSGTASIDETGELVHLGSIEDQVGLTLNVVGRILERAGMNWTDAVRGVAYFRDAADVARWAECRAEAGVPAFPCVVSQCVVCWPGLLFELELEAAR